MPIPLIVWAAGAAGAAYLAWRNRQAISDYFNSEEFKKLLKDMGESINEDMKPYQRLLDDTLHMESGQRRMLFAEVRARFSKTRWDKLVTYGRMLVQLDSKYTIPVVDLLAVDGGDEVIG